MTDNKLPNIAQISDEYRRDEVEFIKTRIRELGCDGVVCPGECGCSLDDFPECGESVTYLEECFPAYRCENPRCARFYDHDPECNVLHCATKPSECVHMKEAPDATD